MHVFLPVFLIFILSDPASAQNPKIDSSLIGSVVKSNSWKLNRTRGVIEELIGDVIYLREDRQLRSDWALYDHGTKLMQARGNIRGYLRLSDGALIRVSGDNGEYNTGSYHGHLSGVSAAPVVVHVTPGAYASSVHWKPDQPDAWASSCVSVNLETPADLCTHATQIHWNADDYSVVLSSDVYFRSSRREAWAELVTHDQANRRLSLEGRRPVVVAREDSWSAALQADRIVYFRTSREARRVEAQGRVHGWLHFFNQPNDTNVRRY